jgi:hypothetical protein
VALGKPMTIVNPCSNSSSLFAKTISDYTILPGPASSLKINGPWFSFCVVSLNTAVLFIFGYKGCWQDCHVPVHVHQRFTLHAWWGNKVSLTSPQVQTLVIE